MIILQGYLNKSRAIESSCGDMRLWNDHVILTLSAAKGKDLESRFFAHCVGSEWKADWCRGSE